MNAETCAHCGLPITEPSRGHVGALLLHHTGTIPPQAEPIDCYRLVTVYSEPVGARAPKMARDTDADREESGS